MSFDGHQVLAHPGDTLASALLANGEKIVARSFKYHRPRGVMSAGADETNALVHLRDGARGEPNTPATMTEAFDGLSATGQNAWPNVRLDFGAVNQLLSPFIGAGFYYKTFMGPVIGPLKGTRFWMACEHLIRRAAGMGRGGQLADPDSYEKVNAHCDVLVVGAGPSGLAAALVAARQGADVILVEQDFALGGSLLSEPADGECAGWMNNIVGEIRALSNVRILTRTTTFGAYDGNVFGLLERRWDHTNAPPEHQPRHRYWQVRAQSAIIATGAIEQPIVFGGNDKPGVMLAGALRRYINRFAVLPNRDIVVATTNDSAYPAAIDAAMAGARVHMIDTRRQADTVLLAAAESAGVDVILGSGILTVRGRAGVASASIGPVDKDGVVREPLRAIPCSLVAMSGGWAPALHLWSQRGRKPNYSPQHGCFVPEGEPIPSFVCVGAAAAVPGLEHAIADGAAAGAQALSASADVAKGSAAAPTPPKPEHDANYWTGEADQVRYHVDQSGKPRGKAFVDLQHDVTLSDIDLAHREGYVSVEHLKRYTTAGMATDQGKTSNVNALARMAELRRMDMSEVGTTTFRPPYTPVPIGSLVGHEHGLHALPTRLTPIHAWHLENGAFMTDAGAWKRPQYYPQNNEDIDAAYRREAAHVRQHVGIVDVSTLGKIAVQGPDAAEFLNRVYVNGWKTLAVGRLRYGIMLREDGFVMDDGATARIGENDYLMSTTTANAGPVLAFLEFLLQTAWRELKVHVTSVTDQWAAIAVAGPKSRELLQSVVAGADLTATALPNNYLVDATLAGAAVRIHRMSYSGELAYEVYTPSGFGRHVWDALLDAGPQFGLIAYGTESMGTLRVEKGHVAGPEIDGRTTLKDLELENFASSKKPFVGSVLRHREVLVDPNRPSLVGLLIEGDVGARPGMLLFPRVGVSEGHGDGRVTSTTYSPALGKYIAMGLLARGGARMGEIVRCIDFLGNVTVEAKVVTHHFFDPEGERQNG